MLTTSSLHLLRTNKNDVNLGLQGFQLDGSRDEETQDEGIDSVCSRVFSGCTESILPWMM